MRRLVVGVIGHVDHGKTALVRALTGMETDRLREERERGISIALGFAHLRVEERPEGQFEGLPDERPEAVEIDLIDMPGHERFVRTMIGGATGIDAVMMVVAANEGIKPQTVEHAEIAVLLGLTRAVLVVSKSDLVPAQAAGAVGREAAAFARKAGLELAAPPILASVTTGEGLGGIRAALAAASLPGARSQPACGFAYLPVDRAFTLPGHGTIVTGTLRRGPLRLETPLAVLPSGLPVRIRALQVHGQAVDEAKPGQRVAVNLRNIAVEAVPRGVALCEPGLLAPAEWLTVRVTSVASAPALRTGQTVQLLYGTDDVPVRLRLLDRDTLEPGASALAQLRCAAPVSVPARERFILRTASPPATIGGGVVLDPVARRLRRFAPRTLGRLEALAAASGDALLTLAVAGAGGSGLPLASLARLAGLSPALAGAALPRLPVARLPVAGAGGDLLLDQDLFDRLLAAIPRLLKSEALSRDRLAATLPGIGAVVLAEALDRLVAAGTLRQGTGVFHLPRPDQEREQARAEALLEQRLAELLRQGGLAPPDLPADTDRALRRALDRLVRAGVVVRTHDRVQKRDVLFHRDAVQAARQRLAPLLRGGDGLLVKEAGAALNISRKFSVPLLEYLDMIQFTRRVGDRRVLAAPIED